MRVDVRPFVCRGHTLRNTPGNGSPRMPFSWYTNATNVISAEHARQWFTANAVRLDGTCDISDTQPPNSRSCHTRAGGRKPPVVIHYVCAAAIVNTTWAVSPGETMRWIADYGRLARRISPQLARPSHGLRAVGEATASPDFSTAGETVRWIADYGRLARRISPQLARPSHGLRAVGEATASPDFSRAGDTTRWIADYGRLARRISPRLARACDGLRAAGQATASPDFSTAGGTMRWIADYGRLARRISPQLARPCDGLRIARELTSSADFSTARETTRRIADYGRLARRISPQLARPCNGLRAAGEATASPDFSTAGETVRLIAEGTLAGIMAINGSECAECVGRCRLGGNAEHSADGAPARNVHGLSGSAGWAETLRMRLTACQERVCRVCRRVRLGGKHCSDSRL